MGNCSAFTSNYKKISNKLINDAKVLYNGVEFYTKGAQWDTGATNTCISQQVINNLGLIHHGYGIMHTPSGEKNVRKFFVDIGLPNDIIVSGIEVFESEIGKQGIDILIGMDIISKGDFSVSNFNGKTVFTFRMPSQSDIDYVQMIKNRTTVRNKDKTYPNDPCPCGSGKKYKQCHGRTK